MKAILIIAALIGFTAVGSYAQDKNCTCAHKTAHKAVHHKTAQKLVFQMPAHEKYAEDGVLTEHPCITRVKDGIVVTECPNTFYTNNDDLSFNQEHSFTGNYPTNKTEQTAPNSSTPPIQTPDPYTNGEQVRSAGNDLCLWGCRKH